MDRLDGSPLTYGGYRNEREVCRSRGAETRGGNIKFTGDMEGERSLGAGHKEGEEWGRSGDRETKLKFD